MFCSLNLRLVNSHKRECWRTNGVMMGCGRSSAAKQPKPGAAASLGSLARDVDSDGYLLPGNSEWQEHLPAPFCAGVLFGFD